MIDLKHVHDLMEQEVSRKEFLRYVGVGLLSAVGITNIIKNLSQPLQLPTAQQPRVQKSTSGYGMSPYGR